MPIYEFKCKGCGKKFEELVFGKINVKCPKCGKKSVEKLMSTFAVSGVESAHSHSGSCGGTCKPSRHKCNTCY